MASYGKLWQVAENATRSNHYMNKPDEIFTAKTFCEHYGVSRSLLSEMLARGEIEAKRLGNRVRIHRTAAEAWFNSLPDYEPATA